MPCEVFVKAMDTPHTDPNVRLRVHQKGDFVDVLPYGNVGGTGVGVRPPYMVRLTVTDLDVEQARAYLESWDYEYDFQILQRSIPQDGWRFKIVNLQRRLSDNAGTPTVEQIRHFFEGWKANFVRVDPDGAVFDWTIAAGAVSQFFLGGDVAALGLVIVETGYDEATGWHTYSIDWSGATFPTPAAYIRDRVLFVGGEILSAGPFSGTYRLHRDSVRDAFVDALKSAREMYKVSRYSLPPGDVDAAIAAGGVMTVTTAQIASKVIDARGL